MDTCSIACRSCGYPLDGITSDRCPECGEPFDLSEPASFKRILSDPVRLATLPIGEAMSAQLALERGGIPASVHQEAHGIIMHYDLPKGSIWVNCDDKDRARHVLADLARRAQSTDAWQCPKCGEQIEPQFDVCWSCGSERQPRSGR